MPGLISKVFQVVMIIEGAASGHQLPSRAKYVLVRLAASSTESRCKSTDALQKISGMWAMMRTNPASATINNIRDLGLLVSSYILQLY
jgi:hypothetical protein